ncbi:hypothetical protein AAHA92_33179 [Salvia divinorum]|uniref:RING-type domain-containing protein n=1 Tax=Salvia divinorum TaxID=28513 RepID=A0ABD1FN63_SALDI
MDDPYEKISQQKQRTPPEAQRVKWKGFEESVIEPSGNRCFLCKRDVAYTAGGTMYGRSELPAVAVLPCGHVFHDYCLQLITPPQDSQSPPCIPCALDR